MSKSRNSNFDHIAREHSVLLNEYGRVQSRCSELIARQVDQIEALRVDIARKDAEIMRLRARLPFALPKYPAHPYLCTARTFGAGQQE